MNAARVLEVTAVKEGKWWTITIPELNQVTATKKASEVQEYAESLAAVVLDVPEDQVTVNVKFDLPPAAAEAWSAARLDTLKAKEETMSAAAKTKAVIEDLRGNGASWARN
ncbi:hypothetical protein SAMN04489740_4276 [Arthrobacter alpinus]|uniref:Uncharacterized protein n=1 Tax=Arthrobacter alpinus TaxID=656366 RepID=A0A1H5PHM0_9MICC|nr:hypothetical protein [Arthrobacter alpinus]SEF12698.1 hypothetical protein SAMN04489740_4276 [Arthrobacter alpinus]